MAAAPDPKVSAGTPAESAAGAKDRNSFFRQSGWLMIANITAGGFMWAVHFLSRATGPDEYGVFVVFLAVAMMMPTMPLQMVLAQQTARAAAIGHEGELRSLFRGTLLVVTLLWAIAAVLALVFQQELLDYWKVDRPIYLRLTLVIVLLSLWMPILWGTLQGRQNFFWYGWSMITNGLVRLVVAAGAVFLGAQAAGMLGGVTVGLVLALLVGVWQTADLWRKEAASFDYHALLKQVIPLMLGFGAFQFMFTADSIFAKGYFDKSTMGFYGSAGTLSRALMWLVGPMAAVMFPRLVHSAAKSEKSNLMNLVFVGTAVLAICGALAASVLGPWIVRLVSGKAFVAVASSLVPWYSFAMVPVALANVLLSSLMARNDFRCVPALVMLVAAYSFALTRFHATPVQVLQTMGLCNAVMLAICAWYTWVRPAKAVAAKPIV